MGKEADITHHAATLVRPLWSEHETAKSGINVYANDPREMCET
jgi:hypothetical protein